MPKKQTFTATIQNAGGGGAFVEIPFDVEKEFGSKGPGSNYDRRNRKEEALRTVKCQSHEKEKKKKKDSHSIAAHV